MRPIARHAVAALLVLGCSGPSEQSTSTEILWDTWGVAHIYAPNDAQAFKAFGYAQMQAHGNLLMKLYAEARGRSAEYWGESQLRTDRFVRTMGIPARAAEWYGAMSPVTRANLDAFATGVNLYASEHPDQIADSLKGRSPVERLRPRIEKTGAARHGNRVAWIEVIIHWRAFAERFAFHRPNIARCGHGVAL